MFIERLTEKDVKNFLKNYAFSNYYSVEEVSNSFSKDYNLEKKVKLKKLPEILNENEIKSKSKNNLYFVGYNNFNMHLQNDELIINFHAYKIADTGWNELYFLSELDYVLKIKDFSCKLSPLNTSELDNKKFMHSKFGESYLTALKEHLKIENVKNLEK